MKILLVILSLVALAQADDFEGSHVLDAFRKIVEQIANKAAAKALVEDYFTNLCSTPDWIGKYLTDDVTFNFWGSSMKGQEAVRIFDDELTEKKLECSTRLLGITYLQVAGDSAVALVEAVEYDVFQGSDGAGQVLDTGDTQQVLQDAAETDQVAFEMKKQPDGTWKFSVVLYFSKNYEKQKKK